MAVITLTSDMGTSDYYVALVKAILTSELGNLTIVDISHDIEKFNIAKASFVLSSVFREFPEGTIHIVSVNDHDMIKEPDAYIVVEMEGHFFIGPNNGMFSLLGDEVDQAVSLEYKHKTTFPMKELSVPAAISLVRGLSLNEIGKPIENIRRMLHRSVKRTEDMLIGAIIDVDSYGNLITNITKKLFQHSRKNRSIEIQFGRERIGEISENYGGPKDGGECVVLFNDLGYLEIAIVKGRACDLLGLRYDSPVAISFS